ncbi:MAG TPA: VanZ family protein [Segetibacter sp.]|jgi:VanZ family protein
MRIRKIDFIPATVWFISSTILLSLPGDDLPNAFINFPNFDKFVHFFMFFLLTVSFCFPFTKIISARSISWFNQVALYVILYGIVMEFVQKYLVPNRSFDVIDIVFDSLGSIAGLFAARWYSAKKIGPNGNRGRNQN